MHKLFFAAASAAAIAAVPAMAQVHDVDDKRDMTTAEQAVYDAFEPDQRADFDRWDSDRQVMYFGWTDALRGYYWSLEPEQQNAWWYLNDEQRATLFQIQAPEQRTAAWNSVVRQVAELEADTPATGTTTATASANARTSAGMTFARNEVVQQLPTSSVQNRADYPVCQSDNDDHCINAWAAGQRGPGVDRPLNYWPGESVTESQSGG